MLELILTRFEDKELFPLTRRDIFKFLVMDELHTYSGRRGTDVACLVRRLKWHTGTVGKLICIGTSATIQSGEGEDAKKIMAEFASKLFGEEFKQENIIGESLEEAPQRTVMPYPPKVNVTRNDIECFDGSFESVLHLANKIHDTRIEATDSDMLGQRVANNPVLAFLETSLAQVKSFNDLVDEYVQIRKGIEKNDASLKLIAGLFAGAHVKENGKPRFSMKLHTFFSQGRGINGTIEESNINLTDKGDTTLVSKNTGDELTAFQIVFCQACGKEFYYGSRKGDKFIPQDLNSSSEEAEEELGYLMMGHWKEEEAPLPDNWLTTAGKVKKDKQAHVPVSMRFDNKNDTFITTGGLEVVFIPEPLMFCPNCGIDYDKRSAEHNKLRVYGRIGRATRQQMC
ncbi:MAG: hypothetical protein MRJ65_01430 [Candidatus Brocadiaceae bacterium]|nr:hypothetical protein [Candidatus Brocadiaceae bacterium]